MVSTPPATAWRCLRLRLAGDDRDFQLVLCLGFGFREEGRPARPWAATWGSSGAIFGPPKKICLFFVRFSTIKLFGYPLILGKLQTAMDNSASVVLSASLQNGLPRYTCSSRSQGIQVAFDAGSQFGHIATNRFPSRHGPYSRLAQVNIHSN